MPYIEEQHDVRRRSITAVMMRAGTSKGLFLHRDHLPENTDEWSPILLSAMGSATGDKRQLDGVGGATSTTSKVAVVGRSQREDADVDYTFAQVAVGSKKVDMSGNCGNMACGVGPFALDEGLVTADPGQRELDIRIFNTNTGRILTSTVAVSAEGRFLEQGDHRISGYTGSGSRIKIRFENPGGSMTGKLFPSGLRQNHITVASPGVPREVTVRATLIDAANPFIFVDSSTLPSVYHQLGPDAPPSLDLIESIRRQGAVNMGLAPDPETAARTRATPKIAVLAPPRINAHTGGSSATADDGNNERQPDIDVTAFSMGKVHPSLQLTGAVCLGAATGISRTVASDLSRDGRPPEERRRDAPGKVDVPEISEKMSSLVGGEVCIGQRGGKILADVRVSPFGPRVEGVTVDRTAQRLFEGRVMLAA
ncbi:MAG: hypothetical protein Q9161_008528 [Pseudevernia consocians]